jgi:caffeoyl-CoA O-methyltransferase
VIPLIAPELERYLLDLIPERDPVIAEMEAVAKERDVPIVGPAVATLLATLAESIEARRICELGSAIGYSTAFFARAVGAGGKVIYTDGSEKNAREASGYLERLGLRDRVDVKVGEAVELLESTTGEFDVVFVDIDKQGYPDAWRAASERIRVGGLYIADNSLGTGSTNVLQDDATARFIREHDELIAADERYVSTIVPTREGVLAAIRLG